MSQYQMYIDDLRIPSQSEMDIHNYIIVRSSREAIMSADNGIYIAKFPEGYRVAYAAAIENLTTHPEGSDERKNVLREYFGESPIIDSIEEAVSYAKELEKKYEYLEYGVVILFNEFESWGNKEWYSVRNQNHTVMQLWGGDKKICNIQGKWSDELERFIRMANLGYEIYSNEILRKFEKMLEDISESVNDEEIVE